jgi:hypothetical protein
MTDFTTTRQQLAAARAAADAATAAASASAQRVQQLKSQLAAASRRAGANNPAGAREKTGLEAALEQANAELSESRAASQRGNGKLSEAIGAFAAFSDPRRNLQQLSDRSPFLLLPVRIETRFATAGERHQLWVRIYPDDCSVDAFEPTLSQTELANAQLYWQGLWRAGGIEADERAAWRSLVAAHGSGRSSWIIAQYQPVNLPDKPTKNAATDEILVIPTQTPLSSTENAATTTYWQAIWLADGDAGKSAAAHAALVSTVGASRAADLLAQYVPFNLNDAPPSGRKDEVALSSAFVVFPPDPPVKQTPWSQAPRVKYLADRFVVLGYTGTTLSMQAIGAPVSLPLIVGPDPGADPVDTIHPDKGDLFVPDELKWLVDFDRAVNVGLGLRIDLTAQQAQTGFDRLLILGVQLSADDNDATSAIEELFAHHHYGRTGLSVVPQGTPTHNTTGVGTGYTQLDNADKSFDDRKHYPLFTPATDPMARRDGDWLTGLLGLDPDSFARVHGSDGADQMQARAMQCALWPATLGYWMDKMLTPVFTDSAVENTRWFFTRYVSGRGPIPAIRIGGQPYGILPTTAFSRMAWLKEDRLLDLRDPQRAFLTRLAPILGLIGADWKQLSAQVSHLGQAGTPGKPLDAHQLLLDIVGLHPASVEFNTRYAESIGELFNTANLYGLGPRLWQAIQAMNLDAPAIALLARLGYSGSLPDILQHFFFKDGAQVANVVDDVALSETRPIRPYTNDGHNYIQWLIDAAKRSLDAVNQEQGFAGNKTPETLLYLFLRHAVSLGYYDCSYNLHRSAGFLSASELLAMKPEPAFVHVADAPTSESRFAYLYKTESRITSSPTLLISDYITRNLPVLMETRQLNEQLQCLETLKDASTASLERAFTEHIDCCSHRHDAWLLGLVNYQLQAMRSTAPADQGHAWGSRGLYLGAYAWIEDLRPSGARLNPVQLPPEVAKNFQDTAPLLQDPGNGGYIHAPSLSHANTAAVLRAGYLANLSDDPSGRLAVDLSSDRVRLALSVLEGIRSGQSFGALLGYQFERGLHDEYTAVEVDKFIYPLRKAFPLVADAITTTKTDPGVSIEAIEARNVLDGLKLVSRIRSGGSDQYPFGVSGLPTASQDESDAIHAQALRLLDIYDAIADLALAEGVHQAVQGNFERIAATLDSYTTGHFPPEPEVVQTPADGIGLTQRVAIHLRPGLPTPPGATPRATVEPALDDWVASLLPPLANIACGVTWTDPLTGADQHQTVALSNLGVRPIDLLYLVKPDDLQSMQELESRILAFVITKRSPRPDAVLQIGYLDSGGQPLSFFQVFPLIRCLKAIVGRSRPLRASDSLLHNDASASDDASVFVDLSRISSPKSALDALGTDLGAMLDQLAPLLADPIANRAPILSGIDLFIGKTADLLARAASFAVPSSAWEFLYQWKSSAFRDLMLQLASLVDRWEKNKLATYDAKIIAYDALPAPTPDAIRFQALQSAEAEIATTLDPLPATPAMLRSLLDTRRASFQGRLDQFKALVATVSTSLGATLSSAVALATADFDAQPFDLSELGDRIVAFTANLSSRITAVRADVTARHLSVQQQLGVAAAADSATARVAAAQAAAQALLGQDFSLYPEFTIAAKQADEWSNALAYAAGGLTTYATDTVGIEFPVDEWLYGIARVRSNMRSWEQLQMLTSAFGVTTPALVPVQFPYLAGPSWYALPYDPKFPCSSDQLLYTACYRAAFDKAARLCGMLLDEWTEVLPEKTRHTGITFNFDRPNNEAPQSFLLVTPATANGAWQWDDLLGALNETLDLAKARAVEPAHLAATAYPRFLPATVMAATLYGISITTALAAANGVFRAVAKG